MIDPQQRDRCLGRLLGKVRRTCRRWSLLSGGPRVAVGLSGGVDSLVMTLLLSACSRSRSVPLDLVAMHVRLDAQGRSGALDVAHKSWCEGLGVEVVELDPRFDPAGDTPLSCSSCARVRRRTLLEGAASRDCALLALGHHGDDVVETWLMSLFYTGTADTLAPRRSYFAGVVTVIRPMYELRRGEIRRLARLAEVPAPALACPVEPDNKRARVVDVLAALGADQRRVRRQLFWAAVRQLEDEA